ncbi:Eaa protein [Escherichia coli]|nr:Eaa protein [Escherichia coli]
MSTITREFTKEQLQQIIETDHVQCGEASALARIALASLEAEPVAWAHRLINKRNGVVHPWVYGSAEACPSEGDIFNIEVMPLYTVPPAPVSVPAAMEMDDDFDSAFEHGKAVGWNAYRAAMLQAEPVSNSDELPLDYLQGHKDGLEWAAQLAEANHPQTGDWLYDDPIDLARAIRKGPDMPTVQGGNSPVTPDGWISCSERMPDDGQHVIILCDGAFVLYAQYRDSEFFDVVRNGEEFFETQSRNVTHWMPLPAAPQQEA